MKEELLKNLVDIFEYVKQGADFVKEQAPLFIQEFITYKIWIYSFWVTISFIFSIICIVIFKKNYKILKDGSSYNDEINFAMFPISILLFIVFFIVFCCCVEELIKVYFAPRYFLVDKILSLGK